MKLAYLNGAALEIRWMWLPTFIGQNHHLMSDLEKAGQKRFCLQAIPNLDEAHQWVIDWICEKVPTPGLREYLSAIEKVEE